MKPHPRIWALVSLLAFIAAGYFWHLGNQRAARPAGLLSATNDIPPGAKPAAAFEEQTFRIVSGPPTGTPAPAANVMTAAVTNRFRYRLTNSPESFSQLVRNDRAILLRNALLDTSLGLPAIPERLRSLGESENYIVQAKGVITPAFRQALKEAGAEIVAYVPNNAYLVRAGADAAKGLAALPLTQSVLPFEPYYKLDPKLLAQAVENQPLSDGSLLHVMGFPGQRDRAVAALTGAGATVLQEEKSGFGPLFVVQMRGGSLADLAQLSAVQVIEQYRERKPANDLARVRLGVTTNTLSGTANYLGLTGLNGPGGSNVTVQVADTGVWAGHLDLTPERIFGATNDANGHGTHVAGTIASSGANSPSVTDFVTIGSDGTQVTNSTAPGSTNGASFRGMAPNSKILSTRAMGFTSDEAIQREAALCTNGQILICNNSWTYGNPDYDLHAASFDAATRDALLDRTGPQPLLFVFAAGDGGGGQDDGQGGLPDTVESPGTAKNVITVGAIEQLRNIPNLVTQVSISGMDLVTNVYAPWLGMTDSSNQVAFFSGRGNTGLGLEGTYGRFKPDVVAPGAMLISCGITNFDYGRTPTTFTLSRKYQGVFTRPGSTNQFSQAIGIPTSVLLSFTVTVTPNAASPNPWPGVQVMIAMNNRPPPASASGIDTATLDNPPLSSGIVRWAVVNPSSNNMTFDMTATLVITNLVVDNNYPQVLSNLNRTLNTGGNPLAPYRYEWGSSMAAASVSGTLALMQEYFTRDLSLTNESPALMKALLINGSRNLSTDYDFDARVKANKEGWGLVNLPSILPAQPASAGSAAPTQFIDQDATNSLPTGFSHTRVVDVNAASSRSPLRITLTWTDPAANPLAAVKLVNDLDLIVTNLANPSEVFVGNYLAEGSIYSQAIGQTGFTNGTATNLTTTNFLAALDVVDNVENVFVPPPLTGPYSVTVRARRVNVNAVDAADPSTVAQDYALVTSVGSLITNNSGLSLTAAAAVSSDTNPVVKTYNTNFVVLVHERVGANPPYLLSNNGLPEQWNFYVFSNATTFTNVAFLTFSPLHVGFLQPNQASPAKPRYHEADLDLYVSPSFDLTNLDPVVMATADRSVSRGGSELVVYTNALPGQAYYVGIKSEDQQAADYSFYALASKMPFSSMNSNGSQVVQGLPLALDIPDGSPDSPGGTTVVAIAMFPMTIQRVTAEVKITHELGGDLTGNLSHTGVSAAGAEQSGWVMLNNHRVWYGTDDTFYDDSKQGDITNAIPADGPGSLNSFMGMEAQGVWYFDAVDNALQHTGRVDEINITIDPVNDTNALGRAYSRRIGAGGWLYAVVDVPADATNLHVCVTATGGGVDLYIRRGDFPTRTAFDLGLTNTTGGCLDWSILDPVPPGPLQPGRYYIGVFNYNNTAVDATLTIEVQRQFRSSGLVTYVSTNAMPLLDDALTNATIRVTDRGEVAMVQVGVRIEHERASDLVLHLISPPTAAYPQGLRLLLAENRGETNTNGYGATITNIFTNVVRRIMDNGFEGTNTLWGGTIPVGGYFLGWHLDSGQVDLMSPTNVVADTGTNALDLNGWVAGAISTNLVTKSNSYYLLSFAFTKNPGGSAGYTATADVQLGGSNIMSLAAGWPNSQTNPVWQTTSALYIATSPFTTLAFISTIAGNAGVYLDSIHVDEVVLVTNFYRYCVFTEDPAKARTPIKFGEPPWANTNQFLTNLILGSFETAAAGTYDSSSPPFEGWQVLTNKAAVITDTGIAYAGSNFLALGSAEVAYNLPTIPDTEYRLTFAYRSPGIVGWWPAEGSGFDLIAGNDGVLMNGITITNGYVGEAFKIGGGRVFLGDPPALALTGSLTIEAWVHLDGDPNPGCMIFFRGDNRSGLDPYFLNVTKTTHLPVFAICGASPVTLFGPSALPLNQWSHVAGVLDHAQQTMKIYVNGRLVATTNTAEQPFGPLSPTHTPGVSIGNVNANDMAQVFPGLIDEPSLYNRGLSEAEIFDIYQAATAGKWDALTPMPNFTVSAPGLFTNTLVASTNDWSTYSVTFVAADTNTAIHFAGHPLGVLIDKVEIIETGNKFYLPEESLAPMFGQSAFGNWQLEIWDNRLGGQLSNGVLRSWELQLGFVNSNATPTYLTNHLAFGGTVLNTNLMFFIVDTCTNGGLVTHILKSLSGSAVDLLFNRFGFPTTVPGDAVLLSGTTNGTSVVRIPSVLMPQPGRYYLAVRNTDPNFDATFTLEADVTCSTNGSPLAPTNSLAPSIGQNGLVYTGNGLKMQWFAPSSASFLVQYADSLDAPVWTTAPQVITSSDGVFTYEDKPSDKRQTLDAAPAITNRFYRLIQLPPP